MTNIIYYIEEKPYQNNQINGKLSKETIKKLQELNILKKLKHDKCKFSFVGIIYIEMNFIIFLPKYLIYIDTLSDIQRVNEIKLILRILKKIPKNIFIESEMSFLSFDSSIENFSLLALIEYIINDYMEYGLYSNEVNEKEYNGDGNISWGDTVDNELIYNSNKQYIYLNYITDLTYSDDNLYISQLHKMILNKSISFMNEVDFLD